MALARKWRPKQFSDVVGQPHVVQALSNALNSGRVHHAYLFTGTRGVGKTTLARIFAKSLNCEKGMSAEPCQQCSVCASVDFGNYVDLIEVDAASRTGIDDMRELLDNVQYAPTSGKFKVYLIDEVHMLSKSSFNALLKTLEEPPEHVKFLFATTDPQKLPVTVLSRCLQFNLQALQPNQISQQITKILDLESIQYSPTAIDLLSRAADGSMRDSLSLLEQAIAQSSGDVQEGEVRAMLGTVKSQHLDALLTALIANDAEVLLQTVQDMAMYSIDFQAALDQLLLDLHHISLAHLVESALANKVDDVKKYSDYAKQIALEDVQLLYQIALISKRDLPLAPDHRSGFEMAVMRMLAFKPTSQPVKEVIEESVALENELKSSPELEIETPINVSIGKGAAVAEKVVAEVIENRIKETNIEETNAEETRVEETLVEDEIKVGDIVAKDGEEKEINTHFEKATNNFNKDVNLRPNKPEPSMNSGVNSEEPIVAEKEGTPSLSTTTDPLFEPLVTQESNLQENTSQDRVEPSFSESIEPLVQPHLANDNHKKNQTDSEANLNPLRSEPTIERDVKPTDSVVPPTTPRTLETPIASNTFDTKMEPTFNKPLNSSDNSFQANSQLQSFSPKPAAHQSEQPKAEQLDFEQQASQNSTELDQVEQAPLINDSDEIEIQVRAASPLSWAGMLERLNLNGLIKELAMNMACNDIDADPMVFHLSPTWSFLHNQPREDSIVKEIHKVRGDNCNIKVVFEDTVHETPAERLTRLKEERMQQTKTDLSDDKGVRDLMDTFELSMNDSTIKPQNEPN